VAVTVSVITAGWATKKARAQRFRAARNPTMPASRLQPTCMDGIAAYGLNLMPAKDPVSWPPPSPTVSSMPRSGTSRGGATGKVTYITLAMPTAIRSEVRSSAMAGRFRAASHSITTVSSGREAEHVVGGEDVVQDGGTALDVGLDHDAQGALGLDDGPRVVHRRLDPADRLTADREVGAVVARPDGELLGDQSAGKPERRDRRAGGPAVSERDGGGVHGRRPLRRSVGPAHHRSARSGHPYGAQGS
jgi:hypothetical protein